MFTFNDPEDELVFALFLPCGALVVMCAAAFILPLVGCYWIACALRRTASSLAEAARNLTAVAIPDSHGDRVVF
jgi:hypothetical protein